MPIWRRRVHDHAAGRDSGRRSGTRGEHSPGVASVHLPLDREVYSEFSISIGVALYPNDGETSELLLRRADMALYRAKRSGRNQVAQFEAAMAN